MEELKKIPKTPKKLVPAYTEIKNDPIIATAQAQIQREFKNPQNEAIIASMKENGIFCRIAVFQGTVKTLEGAESMEETALYNQSEKSKKTRTAEMWYSPQGLLCEQQGLKGLVRTIVPLANVKFVKPF